MTSAFAFGVGFNGGTNAFWDHWNKGVRVILFVSATAAVAGSVET